MEGVPKLKHHGSRKPRTAGVRCYTRPGEDGGQALVELALVLPIFLLLLIATVDIGRLAYASIEVANAARAGVQYGAQSHITASDNTGMRNAAINDAQNIVGLTVSPSHFCTCSNGASSTCAGTDCFGARMIEFVKVNTTATVNPLSGYPGLPKPFTLRGQAIMRVQQ